MHVGFPAGAGFGYGGGLTAANLAAFTLLFEGGGNFRTSSRSLLKAAFREELVELKILVVEGFLILGGRREGLANT